MQMKAHTFKKGFCAISINSAQILTEAVKGQQNTIESQNNEFAELKTQMRQ
jgi:NifU-like protein involved in Fe-S cluster formation